MFFLNQDVVIRYDILVVTAILFGGFVEVLILVYAISKQKIFLVSRERKNINYKDNVLSYIALALLSASYLATNLLLMRFFQGNAWISQYWTVIFTLSSISIYPLLDIDSILLKVKQENEDILFRFSMVTSIISSVFAALLLFTLSVVIEEESIIKFIYTPSVFISFLVTPLLWNIRSMMRVENILSKRNKITIMSILSAFVLSFYLGGMLDILPVMLFNLIILVEIFIYFIFNLFKRF